MTFPTIKKSGQSVPDKGEHLIEFFPAQPYDDLLPQLQISKILNWRPQKSYSGSAKENVSNSFLLAYPDKQDYHEKQETNSTTSIEEKELVRCPSSYYFGSYRQHLLATN